MKSLIPREPTMPELSAGQLQMITDVVFGPQVPLQNGDLIFVFSSAQAGIWQATLQAWRQGLAPQIFVTGGQSKTADAEYAAYVGDRTENAIITEKLIANGVPTTAIIGEDRSANSLENVIFATEVFDFTTIKRVVFITKAHVVGRHWRTLKQHLPATVELIPYSYVAEYNGITVTRDNWVASAVGRARVWGEYLRIQAYSEKGDIAPM